MTVDIYDHLLIVGTVCSFIQGMTSARGRRILYLRSEIRKYETKQNRVRKRRNDSSK